jgi:uncharacterized protein (DUF433 family)
MATANNRIELRAQPAYSVVEAARYVKVAPATLRSWVVGRPYPRGDGVARFQPLIRPASIQPTMLSFWNLIEAHVLRSLRSEHGVSIAEVRTAVTYAEQSLGIDGLLRRHELRTHAGKVFLDRYGELIKLSASGQLAMRRMFENYLKRVEWDEREFPIRLFPFIAAEGEPADRPIAIDPTIAFGRPVLLRVGVSTAAIVDRIDAGETVAELAVDYGLSSDEIEQAIVYERAA